MLQQTGTYAISSLFRKKQCCVGGRSEIPGWAQLGQTVWATGTEADTGDARTPDLMTE